MYVCVYVWKQYNTGMGINMLVMGAFFVYGVAAFPEDDHFFPDRTVHGTTATCTVQGFFIGFCMFASLSYYSFASLYSYMGLTNNFRVSAFGWIEKYIHVTVYLFSSVPAVVNLTSRTYNPTYFGFCSWSTRSPYACETPEYPVGCERGSPETTYYAATIVPGIFLLGFPTCMMAALYRKAKRNGSKTILPARSVAYQASVYLAILYAAVVPLIINEIIAWLNVSRERRIRQRFLRVLMILTIQSFGLFSLMVYRYFSSERYCRQSRGLKLILGGNGTRGCCEEPVAQPAAAAAAATNSDRTISFNIFDGTNAGGAFAQFVHDGDEDDEENDEKETRHWIGMQGL